MSKNDLENYITENIGWILNTFVEDKLEYLEDGEQYDGLDNAKLLEFCEEIKKHNVESVDIKLKGLL